MGNIGYTNYLVILLILSGSLILKIDRKEFKNTGRKKESKISLLLGWGNLGIGVLFFIANWIYQNYFW